MKLGSMSRRSLSLAIAQMTVDQFYQKWRTSMQDAQANYRAGVQAVNESPMEKAAANKQAWVDGVRRAADDGSFERGLRATTLADWKAAALNVGAGRLADGAVKAERKVRAFWAKYGPIVMSTAAAVRAMPNQTYNDRRARALAMMDQLHAQPYKAMA